MANAAHKITWMTQSEFARLRGVSRQLVSKDVKSGKIPTENGLIDPISALAALALTADPAKSPNPAVPSVSLGRLSPPAGEESEGDHVVVSYHIAKAKRESYQAELARLDWRRKKGELVERADVKRDARLCGKRMKDRMLGIPARLDAILAAEIDPRAIRLMLLDEISKALEGLPLEEVSHE